MGTRLSGLALPQLLEFTDPSLQLALLLAIGQEKMLSFLLHLVELQQGLLAALASLLQLRVPGDKALFQLRSQSLHT